MDFLRNYFVILLALILVFVLNVSCVIGDDYKIDANYDFEHYKVLQAKESRLQLECNYSTPATSSSNDGTSIKWFKEGKLLKPVSEGLKQIEMSGGKLTFKRPSWEDIGSYNCSLFSPNETKLLNSRQITVVAKPYVKIHPDQLIFIEGEEIKIECLIYGRPTPYVIWKFENKTYYNESDERVKISNVAEDENILKSYFKIEHALMSDRGEYTCIAQNIANSNPSDKTPSVATCYVRIKDKYAALWPFLGICVEVVVLCAVIFIYEKKRNKAELEESDTDQSPEQKNTPDHGKESVRQRK